MGRTYSQMKLNIIENNAFEYAHDESFYLKIFSNMINNYTDSYLTFMENNNDLLVNYLNKKDISDFSDKFNYDDLLNLLIFLKNGQYLIDKKNNINQKELEKYVLIDSEEIKIKWINFLSFAEKTLKLKNIKKIHDYLQFLLTFHNREDIRYEYFKILLTEIYDEENNKKNNQFKKPKTIEKDFFVKNKNYNLFQTEY